MPPSYERLSELRQRQLERRAERYSEPSPDLRELERQITGRTPAYQPPPELQRSFFEAPVENLRRGLDYTGQDISQHFGKPLGEAAGGIAGAVANRALDILSAIPREVSPVLVGGGRRLIETGQLPSTATEAKRFGEETKKSVIASIPNIGELDVGLFKINLPGVADIAYDVLTDPTTYLAGVGIIARARKASPLLVKGLEWASVAPGMPLILPLKALDIALGATGLKALTPRGLFNQSMRAGYMSIQEIVAQGEDNFVATLAGRNAPDSILSAQGKAFFEQPWVKPAVDEWLKKPPDQIDDVAIEGLVAAIGQAGRKNFGLQAPRGIGAALQGYTSLLKTLWLAPNPAYPLANLIDALPKILFHRTQLFADRGIVKSLALSDDVNRVVGGYSTQATGEFAEKKLWGFTITADWVEKKTREGVYVPKLAQEIYNRLPVLMTETEAALRAIGVDEADLRPALDALRGNRYYSAKEFVDTLNRAQQYSPNAEILQSIANTSLPGMEDVTREAIDALGKLGHKATIADLAAIKQQVKNAAAKKMSSFDSMRKMYQQPAVVEANTAFAKSAELIRQTIADAPTEAAGMHGIALLYTIIKMRDASMKIARQYAGRARNVQIAGWKQWGQAIQDLLAMADEHATAFGAEVRATSLGTLADDLRDFAAGYTQKLDSETAQAKRVFEASAYTAADGTTHYRAVLADLNAIKDSAMAQWVSQQFDKIVQKHKGLAAAYGTIEQTVAGSPLKQYRQQIEEMINRRWIENIDTLADDVASLEQQTAHMDSIFSAAAEAPPIAQAIPTGAAPLQAAAIARQVVDPTIYKNKVNELAAKLSNEIRAAHNEAFSLTNHAMFNYGDETYIDKYMRFISPFTVWQLRNVPFWIHHLAETPGGRQIANQIDQYVDRSEKERTERNLTRRMIRTTKVGEVNVGTVPLELRAEPYAPFLSAAQQMTSPFVLDAGEDDLGPQGATQFGALMQTFLRFAGGLSVYPHIWIPLQIAGAFGETPVQDILPTSRALRGVGELAGVDTSALDFERSITQPLIRRAGEGVAAWEIPGIPGVRQTSTTGDIFRDENIRRRIAEIGRKSGADVADMLRAMNDPKSALYVRARREVEREENIKGLARLIAPINIKTLSKGEAELRQTKAALPEYNPDRESEDFKLRNLMLKADPGLSAYLDRFDHPAAKEITAQMDDYYSLGDKIARAKVDATPAEGRKALYAADPKAAEVSQLRQQYLKGHTMLKGYFDRDRTAFPTMREYVASIVNEPTVKAKVQEAVSKAGRDESPGVVRAQAEIQAVTEAGKPTGAEAALQEALAQYAKLKVPRYDEYYEYNKEQRRAFHQKYPQEYTAIQESTAARHEFVLQSDILAQWFAFRNKEGWDKQGGEERFLKALAADLVLSPVASRAYIKSKANTPQPMRSKTSPPYRVESTFRR